MGSQSLVSHFWDRFNDGAGEEERSEGTAGSDQPAGVRARPRGGLEGSSQRALWGLPICAGKAGGSIVTAWACLGCSLPTPHTYRAAAPSTASPPPPPPTLRSAAVGPPGRLVPAGAMLV